ncbi:hypothetical protein JMJ77_0012804, partial [Colletotrichum scovillei]
RCCWRGEVSGQRWSERSSTGTSRIRLSASWASLELSRYDCSVRYISLDVATGMWEEFWLTGAPLAAS